MARDRRGNDESPRRGAGAPELRPLEFEPPREVEKRDGRVAPFQREKIVRAVQRAMGAVGDRDPSFAEDVAQVVELALAREARLRALQGGAEPAPAFGQQPHWIPHIEDIQDTVEQALIEMGRAPIAKAYILHRDKRARVRAALAVEPGQRQSREGLWPKVQRHDKSEPFGRERIAAALVAEAELSREVADNVAARVEQRVLDSGLLTLSTGLVRAMVDNELVSMGLTAALARTEPIAIPRYDLARVLAGEGAGVWEPWLKVGALRAGGLRGASLKAGGAERASLAPAALPESEELDPDGLERRLSGEVLRRYALTELFEERVVEQALEGHLHIEDLCHPQLWLSLALPADLALSFLGAASEAPGGEAAFGLLEALPAALRSVSRTVVLEELGPLLSDLVRSTRTGSALGVLGWLKALASIGAAAGRRIDLCSPGVRYSAVRQRLLENLDRLPDAPASPRLYIDEQEASEFIAGDPEQRALLQRLFARGRAIPTWSSESERFVAPGCRRLDKERGLLACGGAVALNLPRLARRAGAGREERFFEDLFGLLSLALEACRSLRRVQELVHAARLPQAGRGRLAPRLSYAVVPVGLTEALRLLGDGEVDPEQGARVLGLMGDVCARLGDPGAPRIVVSPFFGDRARLRFAYLDGEERLSARQPGLFDATDARLAGEVAEAYSRGFECRQARSWRPGEAEAELLRTVPSGALFPPLLDPLELARSSEPNAYDRYMAARARQRHGQDRSLLPIEPPLAPERPRLRLVRRPPADSLAPSAGDPIAEAPDEATVHGRPEDPSS
jgi:transcriptional regulator NrdR family protein